MAFWTRLFASRRYRLDWQSWNHWDRRCNRPCRQASFWARQDGSGAAEFALVVLPMAFIIFAIIQMGSLFFIYNDMHNAAREAVRALAVDERIDITNEDGVSYTCDDAGVPAADNSAAKVACSSLAGWQKNFDVVTDLDPVPVSSFTCRKLTVTISTPMGEVALFDLFGILGNETMQASAEMVTEYTLDGTNFCT